jgi:NADP-dependent 3-hydroxy acid dehydrogenase YdfG
MQSEPSAAMLAIPQSRKSKPPKALSGAGQFGHAVAYAMSEPDDVDINEILFIPTKQEL